LAQNPPIAAQLKASTSEQSSLRDSHRDTPSTSGATQRHGKHEHIKQERIPDDGDNVRISPFSEIDKNEEIPSSLEYKSTSNFSHAALCKDLRDRRQLTDVTLLVGDDEILAHKLLLATNIPYFNKMFCSGMVETSKDVIPILLEMGPGRKLCPKSFRSIIDFVYTREISLHVDNVQDILQTATLLGVDEVIQACSKFMSSHLSEHNVVLVWLFAQDINCANLMAAAEKFCISNFHTFADSADFLQLPFKFLLRILETDNLNVANEELVLQIVHRWIEADSSRNKHLPDLLRAVRLEQLTTECLLRLEEWEPVRSCLEAVQIISLSKNYHLSKSNPSIAMPKTKGPRNSYAGVLICVGGRGNEGDPYKSVEYLEAGDKREWKNLPNMINARRHVGAIALSGSLYAVGGHSGSEHLSSVECFDLHSKRWRLKRQMSTPRRGIALAVVEVSGSRCIFAIGGLDDNMCYNNVEKYDPVLDSWKNVANLRIHRGGVCAVTLNSEVYAIGGNDGVQSKACCEKYSPLLDRWEDIPMMQQRRAGAGATVANGKIFVAGGFDDNAPLSSVEVYNPATTEWVNIKAMQSPRGGVGLAPLSGKLIAVGGHNGKVYLKSVEIYNMETDSWSSGPPTNLARAGSGIAWIQIDSDQLEKEPEKLSAVLSAVLDV